MKKKLMLATAVVMMLASCDKKQNDTVTDTTATTTTTEQTAPETTTPAATEKKATNNNVVLNANDSMTYDTNEIRVKSGEKVTITLHHTGKLGKDTMGHNFVLLAQGTDLNNFATQAMAAKASDYIPAAEAKNIIAHTKLLAGGESDTIEFQAPAPGTYDFLCTFPGHSAVMKGKFIVE